MKISDFDSKFRKSLIHLPLGVFVLTKIGAGEIIYDLRKKIQQYIDQIIANPCDDGSGYYISSSNEILTKKNIESLYNTKRIMIDEFKTADMADRYNSLFVLNTNGRC